MTKLFSDTTPFYKANFHCHTNRSDGEVSVKECLKFYASAGYDILAITDHRKVTEAKSDKLLLIPGIEIDYTFPEQWVHILGLGMSGEIASRWNLLGTPQEGIDLINRLGGVAVLAHPAWSLNTPELMRSFRGLAGVEIWNSVSTLPYNGDRADSSSLLDVTWASGGELLPLFANDDSHYYREEAGVAATMVQAEALTVDAVMEALRAGRFYATTGPQIYQVENRDNAEIVVRCSKAESIIYYSNSPHSHGRVQTGRGITEGRYIVQKRDRYVRVEIRDAEGRKAWSAPIRVCE
ncbi:MAG: CehA/McbA family metallohydrolase [Clostridia bacterium]|nr:CehA/McbA family metallohydrolase [Clostridia bacterium]